jgi:hypothetical protein
VLPHKFLTDPVRYDKYWWWGPVHVEQVRFRLGSVRTTETVQNLLVAARTYAEDGPLPMCAAGRCGAVKRTTQFKQTRGRRGAVGAPVKR